MGKSRVTWFIFLGFFIYCCVHSLPGSDRDQPVLAAHPDGGHFVGSFTCRECHQQIYEQYLATAHFQTSAPATHEHVHGGFRKNDREVVVGDFVYRMLRKRGDSYQQGHNPETGLVLPPVKMDLVIGSGNKGQSFLTWEGEALYQCQISYYPPTDAWINSPGYPPEPLRRPVDDACLKCHVTYASNRDFSGSGNRYNPDEFILGIGCERCHRPAEKHVQFHRANPEVAEAHHMLRLDTLDRSRRLDVCAQCHSGPRDLVLQGNSFSFLSGERLDDYVKNYSVIDALPLDVHGNQYGLLQESKCFQSSSMDCGTCHDPHRHQRGDVHFFNQRCQDCHTVDHTLCSAPLVDIRAVGNDCISCHMPETPSQIMSVQLDGEGEASPVLVRTHRIAVY